VISRSAAGQLQVGIDFAQPSRLPVSVFPGMPGYATGEMGLHSAAFDEPTNDLFQLSPEADCRLILVAKDPGIEVWNDHGSAFMEVGEEFYIGTAPFDTHPLWNIVHGQPGDSYSLTLKVRDLKGVYADSAPFVLSFTPDPPVLNLTAAAPGFLTLSWTPDTSGFVLQVSPTLSPAAWTNAPSGAANPVTLPMSAATGFYRVSR